MLKPSIPLIDLRGKTLVDLLRAYPDKAHALVCAARRTHGFWSDTASKMLLPMADKRSHNWLKRTHNPYLHEVESFADILACRGIFSLNLSYEWGCSGGVYRTDDTVTLLRVLDWPFPDLGKHVVVAWQEGKAGEFYNVTWPGVTGVYNAVAPGRFSAALNLAPMRKHGLGFAGDWLQNRRVVYKQDGLPPAHLLRQVFEQAQSYDMAKHMLANTQLAVPAIFILAGTEAGQGCVIERLENTSEIRELAAGQNVSASNHFISPLAGIGKGWRPREVDSHGRFNQCNGMHGHELQEAHFDWLQPPVLNRFTRLCMISDAAVSRLVVQGFEGVARVTEVFAAQIQEARPELADDFTMDMGLYGT